MPDESQQEAVNTLIRKYAERAENSYRNLAIRLWLAHAVGAGFVISYLGSHTSSRYNMLFLSVAIFLAGLGALVVGDICMLYKDRAFVKRNQSAFSMLDIIVQDIDAPLDRIGMKGPRFIAQLISLGLLLLGIVVTFFAYLSTR